jgi:hypothetical protein
MTRSKSECYGIDAVFLQFSPCSSLSFDEQVFSLLINCSLIREKAILFHVMSDEVEGEERPSFDDTTMPR